MNTLSLEVYTSFAGYLFHRYFNTVFAYSDLLRREVFRIRYDVYCEELRFAEPARFPERQETDEYGPYLLHCLLRHEPSGTFAGCVRLVLPESPSDPLPFEWLCAGRMSEDVLGGLVSDRRNVGEISRLAVFSKFHGMEMPERLFPCLQIESLTSPLRPSCAAHQDGPPRMSAEVAGRFVST